MKKMGFKRVSGYEDGLGSAALEAPGKSHAPVTEMRSPWLGRGPAPAGALQRGYDSDDYDAAGDGYGAPDEPEYVPRRGNFRLRFRGLPRSIGGRIVFGVVVFGVLGAVAVAVAGVRSYLLHDARFMVGTSDDIQINGAVHLTRDQVLSVFGADLERNIFRMPLAERQADLERLPWVGHATLMRLLPNNIRVQITERTPVAFVRQGTQIGLVDGGGVLLDMSPDAAGDPHYSFPVLTGLSADLPLDTRAARIDVYEEFMAELHSADGHLTDSLSEVDVSDPEDVKALIASGSLDILVHFGNEDFLKRYQEFEEHLQEWKQQYPKLSSADMRYEGQIVLEMQGGAGGVSTTDGSAAAPVGNGSAATAVATAAKAEATSPAAVVVKPAASVKPAKLKLVEASVTQPAHKPVAQKAAVEIPVAQNPTVQKPGVQKPAAQKPVAQKPVAQKAVAKKVVAKKPVAKKLVLKKKAVAGKTSSANEKEFAVLAAAHKAALAKASKSGGATP